MRTTWPSSLRSRLTLWYAVLLGVPLAAFAVICYMVLDRTLVSRTDRFIGEALTVFAREVVAERRGATGVPAAFRTTLADMRFRNLRILVRDAAGQVIAADREADQAAAAERDGDRVLAYVRGTAARAETVTVAGASGGSRVLSVPLVVEGQAYLLTGASSLADVNAVLERIRLMFLLVIPLLLALASASAFFLARRGLAPVTAMTARAGEITASSLHARLPVAGDAELTGLARVINELLNRLETAFEQQRRFMADASHELRTPTAIIRTEADVTLARAHRDEPEYRASIGVMRDAAGRLSRIV
ncbi:MAG: HAMP domain-containing protein, partial [Gemmatimonadota bacterium]|nr:HAMP domain-containing protein [Gemmatimonadota bacterium]